MVAVSLSLADLSEFAPDLTAAKAAQMIEDALAMADLVAPCIGAGQLDERKAKAAKAILRRAILRWHDSGNGAVSQQVSGIFTDVVDTRQQSSRSIFWPSEIKDLQKLCKADPEGAWSYDAAGTGTVHAQACAINLGAGYCDCGADIAGFPLFGGGDG